MDSHSESEHDRQLIERAERFGSGGVGLAMAARPRPRQSSLKRAAVVLLPLIFCAAGFAGGRLWDGQNLDRLKFQEAVDLMRHAREANLRRLAMGQVYYFAREGLDALVEHRDDPELGDHARVWLRKMSGAIDTAQ